MVNRNAVDAYSPAAKRSRLARDLPTYEEKIVPFTPATMEQNPDVAETVRLFVNSSVIDKQIKKARRLLEEKKSKEYDLQSLEAESEITSQAVKNLMAYCKQVQKKEETGELLDYEDMMWDTTTTQEQNAQSLINELEETDELLDYEDMVGDTATTKEGNAHTAKTEETDELLDYEDMVGDELALISKVDKNIHNLKENDESDVLLDYEDMERDVHVPKTLEAEEIQRNGTVTLLCNQISPFSNQHKYDLLDKLGKGGFGEVWRARDRDDRECAIKKMPVPYNPQMILAEITHLKQNSHVNIPKYLDSFMVNFKEIWLVMEYISGVDVAEIIYHTKLSHSAIAAICHGVLSALRYLHMKRIIHRDVKGENILVNNQGHVFLADLGISTSEESNLEEAGTRGFMAPEVITTTSYKCGADIWSLGMTIIQMITRHYPYFGCDKRSIRELIINFSLPPIPQAMPKDMTSFLNLCLQYDPSSRPPALVLLDHEYIYGKATPKQLALSVKETMDKKSYLKGD